MSIDGFSRTTDDTLVINNMYINNNPLLCYVLNSLSNRDYWMVSLTKFLLLLQDLSYDHTSLLSLSFRTLSQIVSSFILNQPLPLVHFHEAVLVSHSLPVSTMAHALIFQVLLRDLLTTAHALGTTLEPTANTLMPVPPAHVRTVGAVS